MVRILEDRIIEGNKRYIYAAGLSTDAKPSGNLVTGSMFVEYDDTAEKLNAYFFDEVSGEWKKV